MLGEWEGRWVGAATARRLKRHFLDGWRDLPPGGFRRWLVTVLVGAVVLVGVLLGLQWLARELIASGQLAWEPAFLRRLDRESGFSFSSAVWFQTFGTDITLWWIVIFTTAIAAWARRPLHTLSIPLAYLVVDLTVRLGWALWDRRRPDVIMEGLGAPGFASFPSGHTAKSLAVYGLLAYLWGSASRSLAERVFISALAAVVLALVTFGRLRMGAHWPSDIVGGGLLGLAWLLVLVLALHAGHREG